MLRHADEIRKMGNKEYWLALKNAEQTKAEELRDCDGVGGL